jgi:NhaA family Na+:H+ antiporter
MSDLRPTWVQSENLIVSRFVRPVRRFTETEAASGIVLLAAAIFALLWANLAVFGDTYEEVFEFHITAEFGGILHFDETLRKVINDALMVLFFFVVGLEIKREIVRGELSNPKAAALPAIAALGGMVVPALIYLTFNLGTDAARGWGIPMATDIAFSVGVVALLGTRVPASAKLFLLALAIADDIGAIAVIAVFYTEEISIGWLVAAFAIGFVIYFARARHVRSLGFYWFAGLLLWLATFESGVHATIAGVVLGFLTPASPFYTSDEYDRRARATIEMYDTRNLTQLDQEHIDHEVLQLSTVARESVSPLTRLEESIHPWTSFVVVPLFALANAGVNFRDIEVADAVTGSVAVGVALGLILGKTVGISVFAWIALRLKLGVLPRSTGWPQIVGLAALAGIGFTVSLFITELAFVTGPTELLSDEAKIGIFIGSLVAGVLGYGLLRYARAPHDRPTESPAP